MAGPEDPTAVVMNSSVIWNITPFNQDKINGGFGKYAAPILWWKEKAKIPSMEQGASRAPGQQTMATRMWGTYYSAENLKYYIFMNIYALSIL
jgi:hypothetical protein